MVMTMTKGHSKYKDETINLKRGISALEAIEKSKKGREIRIKEQFNRLMKMVENSAEMGEFSFKFRDIYEENVKALKDLGYKVAAEETLMKDDSIRIDSRISWR